MTTAWPSGQNALRAEIVEVPELLHRIGERHTIDDPGPRLERSQQRGVGGVAHDGRRIDASFSADEPSG